MNRIEYAQGTYLVPHAGPFSCGFVRGRALCEDGKVRAVRFPRGGIADTFFSIPAQVQVSGSTVSGFVTIEDPDGFTTTSGQVVRFIAHSYGKNSHLLPRRQD